MSWVNALRGVPGRLASRETGGAVVSGPGAGAGGVAGALRSAGGRGGDVTDARVGARWGLAESGSAGPEGAPPSTWASVVGTAARVKTSRADTLWGGLSRRSVG